MNKAELDSKLSYFKGNLSTIGVTVYAIMKGQAVPKKIDINSDALPELKKLFVNTLQSEIVENEELSVLKLSSSDERLNAIYEYDIEIPQSLSAINNVQQQDGHEPFNFSIDEITNVSALIIEIGDQSSQVVLYKTMAPVNLYGRAQFFLKKSEHRFEKIDDEFFRISSNFQLFKLDDKLFVVNLKTIESLFGFHDVIKREAQKGVDAVEELALVENPETLTELVNDVKFARKLTKVANASPVIRAGIPNDKIIAFCKTFPKLKGKIRFNSTDDKIQLDTKVSKDLFIQLLMDNFLTSELTQFHYTSVAKNEANENVESVATDTSNAKENDNSLAA